MKAVSVIHSRVVLVALHHSTWTFLYLKIIIVVVVVVGILCTCVWGPPAYRHSHVMAHEWQSESELVLSFYREFWGLNSGYQAHGPRVSTYWDILPVSLHWFLRDTLGGHSGIIIWSRYSQVFLCSLSQAPTKAQKHRLGFKGVFVTNTKLQHLWKNWAGATFSLHHSIYWQAYPWASSLLRCPWKWLTPEATFKGRSEDPFESKVNCHKAVLLWNCTVVWHLLAESLGLWIISSRVIPWDLFLLQSFLLLTH